MPLGSGRSATKHLSGASWLKFLLLLLLLALNAGTISAQQIEPQDEQLYLHIVAHTHDVGNTPTTLTHSKTTAPLFCCFDAVGQLITGFGCSFDPRCI